MRIAIIDIGTNTTRLFVADVGDSRVEKEILRTGRVTRLGAGVDASGRLSPEALMREHAVLTELTHAISTAGVQRCVAVMTSAVRDAADGGDFASDVGTRYGWEVAVLSGEEEAGLTYRGATDLMDPTSSERILVVDIGGGSTELVLGRGPRADFHVSTQAGVVRQSERHLTRDPPAPEELARLREDVGATLAAAVPPAQRTDVQRTLAVAGTPTSLAAVDLKLEPYSAKATHGYRLSRTRTSELLARLLSLSEPERRQVRGLHPDRASVIIPGAIILLEVMELFDLGEVEVSEHDILRGAALHYAA